MLLLVGLGNPGSNYTNTRHNIGFKIIDAINAHFKLSKQKPKFKGLLTTGNIDEKKIYAIKPLTFMNNSGTAIKELIDYFKIDAKDVFVFHDDMDIDFGKIKAKFGGSSAGHNGIESIDKFIGKDYSRVRIGIGHPKQKKTINPVPMIVATVEMVCCGSKRQEIIIDPRTRPRNSPAISSG